MSDEHPGKSKNDDGEKSAATLSILDIVKATPTAVETETATERYVLDLGMLGTCFVLLATLPGLPRLDGPLHNALTAFCIAIPALVIDLMFAGKPKPGPLAHYITAFSGAAWVVAGGVGYLAGAVGVFYWVQHLDSDAAVLIIKTAVMVLVLIVLMAVAGLLVWAFLYRQAIEARWQGPASRGGVHRSIPSD